MAPDEPDETLDAAPKVGGKREGGSGGTVGGGGAAGSGAAGTGGAGGGAGGGKADAAPDGREGTAPDGGPGTPPGGDGGTADGGGTTARPGVLPILWMTTTGTVSQFGDTRVPGRIKIIEDHDGELTFKKGADGKPTWELENANALLARPATLDTPMGIKTRGNASRVFLGDKPLYSVELWDDTKMPRKARLLGMPSESDWILNSVFQDRSYFRDVLALDIARELAGDAKNRWNPRTRFAEAFLNGKYVGIYLVVEKIKPENTRLPVKAPTEADITGSYVFRREGPGRGKTRDWVSAETPNLFYTYHFPKETEITPAQKDYLKKYVDDLHRVFKSPGWNGPAGYRAKLDVASWVDYAIVEELSFNVDGYWKSVYMLKEPDAAGGKLYMTPVWDFNIAFGNTDMRGAYATDRFGHKMVGGGGSTDYLKTPEGFNCEVEPVPSVCTPYVPFYWRQLWSDPAFQKDVKCRWQKLRATTLSLPTLQGKLDAWRKETAAAEKRDHARNPVLGVLIKPSTPPGLPAGALDDKRPAGVQSRKTYDAELQYLRDWLKKRVEWLDANLPGSCQ